MRILVLSDSHGLLYEMKNAINAHPEADAVVFLGDGSRNFKECKELLEGKRVYQVDGNNDYYNTNPRNLTINEGGINIYLTHGHYEYVKSGLSKLLETARENSCTLALYGHTHVQQSDYVAGIYLFNPGALVSGKYGVVDITDKGIMCIGMKT